MRIHCADCQHETTLITGKGSRHYCPKKDKWISLRKIEKGLKKCSDFLRMQVSSSVSKKAPEKAVVEEVKAKSLSTGKLPRSVLEEMIPGRLFRVKGERSTPSG